MPSASAAAVAVLCLDTKKKEPLGRLYRRGHCYSTGVQPVYDHGGNPFVSVWARRRGGGRSCWIAALGEMRH
jgi:hypothetical protein